MISYLVREHGGQHGVVGRRNDEVVVEVVVTVRLDHLTQVRLDLKVTPKAFFVFRNAVALRSYAIWCSSLELETRNGCAYICYFSVINVLLKLPVINLQFHQFGFSYTHVRYTPRRTC